MYMSCIYTVYLLWLMEQQISHKKLCLQGSKWQHCSCEKKAWKKNCKSCVYNCDDLLSYNSSPRNSHNDFHYIHNSHHHSFMDLWWTNSTTRFWLVSSIGKSAEPVSQRLRVQIPYKPEFFSGFLFATAKVAFYNYNDILSYNSSPRSSHLWFSYIHNLIIILLQFLRS